MGEGGGGEGNCSAIKKEYFSGQHDLLTLIVFLNLSLRSLKPSRYFSV